MAEVTG